MTATKKRQAVHFVSGRGARTVRKRKRALVAVPVPAPETFPVPAQQEGRVAIPSGLALPQIAMPSWLSLVPKLSAVLLVIALAAVLYEFLEDERFFVYDFEATGLQHLSKEELEQAGSFVGYNVFFVNSSAIEGRLVKLPEVKSVRVSSGLPNRLAVDVEEREPVMTWMIGNDSYWVDGSGIGFRARGNQADLPLVRDADQDVIAPGQSVVPAGVAAVQALRSAWPTGPRLLEWSQARGLAFGEEHGWKIYLGDASDMRAKVIKLRILIPQLASQNVKVKSIDISKGDPFYQ